MDEILKLIAEGEPLSTPQMASILGLPETEINTRIEELKADGTLLGWRPVLRLDVDSNDVRAVIEVKIAPEREGGFDRIADRIAKFDRVESCYLMSGAYDLLVVLRAQNLQRIAQFVFEKLATIDGVVSTSTHFMLRAYKESGFLIERAIEDEAKPAVSP